MSWKRSDRKCGDRDWPVWAGTGVVAGFFIVDQSEKRGDGSLCKWFYVYHGDIPLGVARTRYSADHCADEFSRMILFNTLGIADPCQHPCLVGDSICYQGRILLPDPSTGFNWKFEGEHFGRHQTVEDLFWEEAWWCLTRTKLCRLRI
jgi:hypothetical protein